MNNKAIALAAMQNSVTASIALLLFTMSNNPLCIGAGLAALALGFFNLLMLVNNHETKSSAVGS